MKTYPANLKQRQRGASAAAILAFLAMASLLLLVAFKLYPIYYDHWTIMSVADSFKDDAELPSLSENEIVKRYKLRLQTNGIRDFDFDNSVFVEKVEKSLVFEIDYERRTNLYRNVDAVVIFSEKRDFPY